LLSISFFNFRRYFLIHCSSPFVSVALALGDEGYHTKSHKQGQHPCEKIIRKFSGIKEGKKDAKAGREDEEQHGGTVKDQGSWRRRRKQDELG